MDNVDKILVIHQNVTPYKERVTEFTYDELSQVCNEKKIKYLICGHYHIGYPTETINGVTIINPWNLWRVVRDYHIRENEHTPEFVVLDLNSGEFEHVIVPHKKYADAFDLKEIEFYKNLKKENKEFFEFAKSFNSLEDLENDDDLAIINEFIQNIKEKYNFDNNDINKIITDLSKYFS